MNEAAPETRQVVLITGASAGIGAELAKVFAAHGHDLVLIARRGAKLEALADEIAATAHTRPLVLPVDLTEPGAAERIKSELAAQALEPHFVVNNAGFGLVGEAAQLDHAEQLAMIDLNIRFLTELSLAFVDTLARLRGGILNVSSVAGFLPGPGMAVYYATKAYVLSFSEALHHELARRGVRVTVLCPGPVPTEFQTRAGFRPGFDSAILNVSPADVAQQGYDGLMANKRAVLPGFGIKIVPLLLRLFPRGFILWAVGRFQQRKR
jgi:uncharacterized protein